MTGDNIDVVNQPAITPSQEEEFQFRHRLEQEQQQQSIDPAADVKEEQMAFMKGVGNGAVMGYGPEVGAGLSMIGKAAMTGKVPSYFENRDAIAKNLQETNDRNPMAYPAGNFAGSVLSSSFLPEGSLLNGGPGMRIAESAVKGAAYGGAANPGEVEGEASFQGGQRLKNSLYGAGLGGGVSAMAESTPMWNGVKGMLGDVADSQKVQATGGPRRKIIELLKKGTPDDNKLLELGRFMRDNKIGGFFSGPEEIHSQAFDAANKIGDEIGSDIHAAQLVPGQDKSINTTVLKRQLQGSIPGSDVSFSTAQGKNVFRGPIQDELQNLGNYGAPVDNPGNLGAGISGRGAVSTGGVSEPPSGGPLNHNDVYLGSSNSGGLRPQFPEYDAGYPGGGQGSLSESAGAPDLRERVTGPEDLWRLRQGLGKQIDWARTNDEMPGREQGVAQMYHKLGDVLNKNVEGVTPRYSYEQSLPEKMDAYHQMATVRDMALHGAAGEAAKPGLTPMDLRYQGASGIIRNTGSRLHSMASGVAGFGEGVAGKVADFLEKDPSQLGQFARPLKEIYESGDRDRFSAAVFMMMKRPEFVEKMGGKVDRSQTTPLSEKDRQSQFLESN